MLPLYMLSRPNAASVAVTYSIFDYPYHSDHGMVAYRAVVKWNGGKLTFRFDVKDGLDEPDSPVFAPGRPLEQSLLEGDVYLDIGDGCLEQLDQVLHGFLFMMLGLTFLTGEETQVHTGVLFVEGVESTLRTPPMMLTLLERLLPPPRKIAKMQVRPKKKKKPTTAPKAKKKAPAKKVAKKK